MIHLNGKAFCINMTFIFLDISEENKKEFQTQLKIVYKSHFPKAKIFKEVFKDWREPEISIPNDLYFDDIEKAKDQMYEEKSICDGVYMKDFISDLQENLSFVPVIKALKEIEYDAGHSFTVEEMNKIKEWQKQHRLTNHPEGDTYQGAVAVERFKYTLLGTSIGMIKNCFCKSCREKYEEESKPYTTGSLEELTGKVKPKYSREERRKKLDELRKKWDYEIDFSDW